MDATTRSKLFQKIGFWEEDLIRDKQKTTQDPNQRLTFSCGNCNKAVLAADCEEKITPVTNSQIFTVQLCFHCPLCGKAIIGACE